MQLELQAHVEGSEGSLTPTQGNTDGLTLHVSIWVASCKLAILGGGKHLLPGSLLCKNGRSIRAWSRYGRTARETCSCLAGLSGSPRTLPLVSSCQWPQPSQRREATLVLLKVLRHPCSPRAQTSRAVLRGQCPGSSRASPGTGCKCAPQIDGNCVLRRAPLPGIIKQRYTVVSL